MSNLAAVFAAFGLGMAGPALAQEPAAPETDGPVRAIIRADDASLTCAQIGDEAAQLSQTMGGEPDGGVFGALGGVARSGAAMLIPGAGLLMAGADALTKPDRDRQEAETLAVEHRWYYLNGLYSGRDCRERAEAAQAAVTAAPAVAQPGVVAAPDAVH